MNMYESKILTEMERKIENKIRVHEHKIYRYVHRIDENNIFD
jgi:hypothetical protein